MGEDEFAVASTCSDSTDAAAIIQRLLHSPKAPFDNHGADVRVAASIGISRSGPGAATARVVFERADRATYQTEGA
ncbi:diguanylate cyclase domain-containing protein [Pseudomonas oryzihabitans]|uniref:diguanylate cyclase domain-containing protein n=1 Tax=Pseudomonas oryzihabitans TaxID=47885 RepID=UPI0034615227